MGPGAILLLSLTAILQAQGAFSETTPPPTISGATERAEPRNASSSIVPAVKIPGEGTPRPAILEPGPLGSKEPGVGLTPPPAAAAEDGVSSLPDHQQSGQQVEKSSGVVDVNDKGHGSTLGSKDHASGQLEGGQKASLSTPPEVRTFMPKLADR
jgi:hypothetical protein